MNIRVVPTASGSFAIQVVRYTHDRTIVLKHIGSGKCKEDVAALRHIAREWIEEESRQGRLFSFPKEDTDRLLLGTYRYAGFRYGLIAETIQAVLNGFGITADSFSSAGIFVDLVLARIVEPASKRRSRELLSLLFGITHSLTDIYRALPGFASSQETIEEKLIAVAVSRLGFDFRFVLYDITTLYFETFTQDEFRKTGFSKDNKVGQPQILVGLIVTEEGFPVSFSLFEGNTFEGHTLIPVILAFKKKHDVEHLTVVADAAMISKENVRALEASGLDYIVGARLGSIGIARIRDISQKLHGMDGSCVRIPANGGFLICHFSVTRYAKDKHEMDKQLEKAKQILSGKQKTIRNKFLAKDASVAYRINAKLVEKATLLLGIKGYYTNLDIPERIVIARYADLWQIERAFRISKHDLEARPVYHVKKQAIIAHMLICVTALAVLKWLELKSGLSAKRIVDQLKSVTDARMVNVITGRETLMRSKIPGLSLLLDTIAPH